MRLSWKKEREYAIKFPATCHHGFTVAAPE
jgi:hypothetical protein